MLMVLGASSFSGDNFILNCLNTGIDVLAVGRTDNRETPFSSISSRRTNFSSELFYYQFDLNYQLSEIVDLARKYQVDQIVNFAAQSMVSQSWDQPEDWYSTNVTSLAKLASGLRQIPNIRTFVQFTTPEVYGSTAGWIKESYSFSPTTPYAISRAAGDWHLKSLFDQLQFPVIFTRAANVYGPHQRLYRIIPRLVYSGIKGIKVPIHGGGTSIRAFISGDDVSRALNLILTNGILGNTYHISTQELSRILDIGVKIAAMLNIDAENLMEVAPERTGKDFAYQLNSDKIRTELGWQEEISLTEGIQNCIDWVNTNIDGFRMSDLEYFHRK